jgi:dethiobiotin synthase
VFRGLFVTGTDTGVGKTAVSAGLMHRFRAEAPLRYWKPIQTGIEHDDDTGDMERLGGCVATEIFSSGVRLPRQVSPHLAARLEGVRIELEPLVRSLANEPTLPSWIIEGAGGVLVPVNDSETMIDLMTRLGLPTIVAARTVLGTINHTLLTVEALRRRNLHVAGIVMVGDPHAENRAAIERYGRVAVVGEMPTFHPLNAQALASWAADGLDPDGSLLEYLR